MASEIHLRPGRLSITCIDAKNIRGRADNAKEDVSPYLLFRLNGTERTSKTGKQRGHDVLFDKEIVAFDLPRPEDAELVVEVRDEGSNEAVGRATFSLEEVLTTGAEALEELEIIKPGDKSTNSVVNLKFAFVAAKTGVVKLRLDGVANMVDGKDAYAVISTPDGQSQRASTSAADDAVGFWMDPANWFSDLSIQLHVGDDCVGGGTLPLLSCLDGNEIKYATSEVPIQTYGWVNDPVVTVDHWFLEAGVVRVRSVGASGLRDASVGATGLVNPRVVMTSNGKTHSTTVMTNAAVDDGSGSYNWKDDIRLSVVDEYALTIECAEVDEVSGDRESIGSTEISLLPLFRVGRHETSVDLKHVTEVRTATNK